MDGQPCVLMRLLLTNGTVNYESLYLEHGTNNEVKANDLYIYLNAQKLSDSLRQLVIPILQDKDKSVLERMFGDKPDLVKYAPQWRKLGELNRLGKFQETLDVCAQLPDSLKTEKFVLIQRMVAAQKISDSEYLDTISLWRKTYPNDASLDLISIDYYTMLKQYDEALACVDRVDKIVGDPWLDLNRAFLYTIKKDETNAEKFAEQAFEREPDLSRAGLFVVELRKNQQDYEGCVRMLEKMHTLGHYTRRGLDQALRISPKNADLVQSPVYLKWLATITPSSLQNTNGSASEPVSNQGG
jgi:tetratricopeptide (TPR) repeat protein